MPKISVRSAMLLSVAVTILAGGLVGDAQAQDATQSTNYRFEESVLGGGGLVQSNSANYKTDGAVLGDTAVGESASANYQLQSGNKTTPDPALSFSLDNGSVNFNTFSATSTSTAEAAFSVSNYTSYGYSVQLFGEAPKNGAHTIAPMTISGAPATGIEQFGVNLVANATPVSVGHNVVYGPFGKNAHVNDNYDDPGSFRFVSGEQVAYGGSSSGLATYTIAYIANVSGLTPGGQYTGAQTLICTGTF